MANVLLVDDEPDFVAATRELLTMHGHSVDTAERLDDARRILGNDGPEVLLLDLMLPDGNGLELWKSSAAARSSVSSSSPGIRASSR
jgi:DNA-binding response OmpR family regulator